MRYPRLFIGLANLLIAPALAAQADTAEPPLSKAAVAAVETVRRLYDHRDYVAAIAAADTAMRQGAGSTELQAWRVASLVERPDSSTRPLRTARRMASMHPTSPWSWMGLAMAAATTPDSASVAREAATRSLTLAPRDSVVRAMALRALTRAGFAKEAEAIADSVVTNSVRPEGAKP
jgi:hypothetical protein